MDIKTVYSKLVFLANGIIETMELLKLMYFVA